MAVISALFAALKFSDVWAYVQVLEQVPERDPEGVRKNPSRWGAAFVRTAEVAGVTDAGNAFYHRVMILLEEMAKFLNMLPLTTLHRKLNTHRKNERAGGGGSARAPFSQVTFKTGWP